MNCIADGDAGDGCFVDRLHCSRPSNFPSVDGWVDVISAGDDANAVSDDH